MQFLSILHPACTRYCCFSSLALGGRLPLLRVAVASSLRVVQRPQVDVGHPRGVLLERTVGVVPLVRLLEEGIVKGRAVGRGDLVVLMGEPAVPLGRHHIAIGTPDGEVIVVLDPPALVAILLVRQLHSASKSS